MLLFFELTSLIMTQSSPPSRAPAWRWWIVFIALFLTYQLPEGLRFYELMLLVLPVAWLGGRFLGYRGFDAWYLSRSPRWLSLLAVTFLAALAMKAVALAVGAELGVYRIASAWSGFGPLAAALPMVVLGSFVASISEDILTRGFIKRALPSVGGCWIFIPVSALLYVLNHIYRLGNGPLEWMQLFCYGLAYAAALHYSGSLWPAVGLHWGWNFANSMADATLQVDRLSDIGGPLLSSAAHLILLVLVLACAPKLFRSGSYRTVMS